MRKQNIPRNEAHRNMFYESFLSLVFTSRFMVYQRRINDEDFSNYGLSVYCPPWWYVRSWIVYWICYFQFTHTPLMLYLHFRNLPFSGIIIFDWWCQVVSVFPYYWGNCTEGKGLNSRLHMKSVKKNRDFTQKVEKMN